MLGVDQKFQGRGLGSALLADTIERSLGIADSLGSKAIVVDLAGDGARSFYTRYGFASIPGTERMYLPLKL
jgi:ribosomal protein S18 acetylase RimI-like enzyme